MSAAEGDHAESMDSPSPDTDGAALRQRTGKRATKTPEESAAAPGDAAGAASESASASKPNVAQVNQGASQSSAHICSNTTDCPLIKAWEATPPADRDSLALSEDLFACSACRSAAYCSLSCQRVDWLEHGHRDRCAAMRAAYAEKHPGQIRIEPPVEAQRVADMAAALAGPPPPTTPVIEGGRRNYHINFYINLGPRTIIVLLLLLYLIYRFYWRHPAVAPGPATQAPS